MLIPLLVSVPFLCGPGEIQALLAKVRFWFCHRVLPGLIIAPSLLRMVQRGGFDNSWLRHSLLRVKSTINMSIHRFAQRYQDIESKERFLQEAPVHRFGTSAYFPLSCLTFMVGPASLPSVRLRAFSIPILVARHCRLRAAKLEIPEFPLTLPHLLGHL